MTDLSEILQDPEVQSKFKLLKAEDQISWAWRAKWLTAAHKYQVLPPGDWWTIWLMLAGRGAGKTRTAAEQIGWWALRPRAMSGRPALRVTLVCSR